MRFTTSLRRQLMSDVFETGVLAGWPPSPYVFDALWTEV